MNEQVAWKKNRKPITKNKAWAYVVIGGALEIVWASGFKYEEIPSIIVLIALLTSFDLVIEATKILPVGTTYAVFAGIGTVGTIGVEAFFTGELSLLRIGIILLLLLFIFGLKMTSGEERY
ncbi:DMT family transporter [Paenibacillus sp. NPDC058910]|uniref:DMT family transporter n=1 Tax=unclassified Paenibacillus TaxID=185978 RepID=UPI0036A43B03